MSQCKCIFPTAGEEEFITIPGNEPGTAMRVFVQGGRDGCVRIQEMAHDQGLGWYVQKSMVIPRNVLAAMLPQLRKALCLMPQCTSPSEPDIDVPYMWVGPVAPKSDETRERVVS